MASTSNVMTSDQPLKAGEYLVSNNRRFIAMFQGDANLCVYEGFRPQDMTSQTFVWGALGNSQDQTKPWQLRIQSENGELGIYDGASEAPIWSNGVNADDDDYYLVMQDDGLLCEYEGIPPAGVQSTGHDGALWSTGADRLPGSACASVIAGGLDLPWRELTLGALGKVPEVGEALSEIVGFFWTDDMWGQVEAMIQEEIRKVIITDLTEEKEGLQNVYNDYKRQCDDYNAYLKNPSGYSDQQVAQLRIDMRQAFHDTQWTFDDRTPKFMRPDFPLDTLKLMTIAATMHLYLYRDGLRFGPDWGIDQAGMDTLQSNIGGSDGFIAKYCRWVDDTIGGGLPPVPNGDRDSDRLLQWIARNNYVRDMTINVLDARAVWPFLNPKVCPDGQTPPKLTREIYSDPFGIGPLPEVNLPDVPPWSTPALPAPPLSPRRLTAISVEGDDMAIWGVTVTYTPDGVGPRMGGAPKGGIASPYGLAAQISADNPVIGVSVTVPDESIIKSVDMGTEVISQLTGMMLVFKDGTTTGLLGRQVPEVYARTSLPYGQWIIPGLGSAQYPGHVLSSISVVGLNIYNQVPVAGGVVFGFRLEDAWT